MLAKTQSRPKRRGIVLVLVLGMLGLLALVGVTFATFSGQSRINNRNFQQSLLQPQADELLEFGLAQLISDTNDIRSAIRGHSLARDMYGQGSTSNGYLPLDPTTGLPFYITAISTPVNGIYTLTTNIDQNDPNFYGYNFTRWIMRVSYAGPLVVAGTVNVSGTNTVSQTFEVLSDSNFSTTPTNPRTFGVFISSTDAGGSSIAGGEATVLNNPTPTTTYTAGFQTQLPGAYLVSTIANGTNTALGTNFSFQLDGRWLHAFNGPGMGANAAFGNFRYNGLSPNAVGMDEDYDACDLENWFLAIQSADGQVMIPSFHRPANIRYDPNNVNAAVNDWARLNMDGPNQTPLFGTSAARILRPVAADGNDATTFPDLIPSTATGQITYDVDNDGDGVTDSVWLDLGYPARPDASGRLYKPLFAFMVIGLNGRIPLNTAGNLAGANQTHSEHLGNSVSEADPTYALQNGYAGAANDYDPFNTLGNTFPPATYPLGTGTGLWGPTTGTNNGQVDNTVVNSGGVNVSQGLDVRLSQLRNLLAGTRPQSNPLLNPAIADTTGAINGDDNLVYGSWTSGGVGQSYYMPNGIADFSDVPIYTDAANNPYVQRTTAPVPGRWGEAQSVPGVPFANPNGPPAFNWVQHNYTNPVRAGYSFDISDLLTSIANANANNGTPAFPRDAADDNFNAFDPYPIGHAGENLDADFYDTAGALLLPLERIRRWVAPADINGTGQVVRWNLTATAGPATYLGADNFGRVQFHSYYRPAGPPGNIDVTYTYNAANTPPTTAVAGILGAVYYPNPGVTPDPYYEVAPNPINPTGGAGMFVPAATADPNYLPDMTNNPFHGFEAYKLPNLFQNPGILPYMFTGTYSPQTIGGMQIDQGQLSTTNAGLSLNVPASVPTVPATFPTYDAVANQSDRSDGLNEADEMNVYTPNPLLDSPFGPTDLEWLYRQQDVDGSTLSSRLSKLAPISFTNAIDGLRRRRLVALDSRESNNFVWTNDNPGGAFANNARFTATQSAGLPTLGPLVPTPTLAQRDKKINLNYPLPVSNDCNEPIRQKWISDTYQLIKRVLPPDSVDTAEELAQLSQFVINIVDFRDPDGTMTHWVNPDVVMTLPTVVVPTPYPPTLTINVNNGNLDQYGMEYNPVAINEALAYSFATQPSATGSGPTMQTNRFFIELVNTLPAAYNPAYDYASPPANPTNNYYGNASAVTLGGFNYTANDPYSGGCWDLVFTNDDPLSRPDPYRGELAVSTPVAGVTNYYGLIPLNRDTFAPTPGNPALVNNGDVTLLPVNPAATSPNYPLSGVTTPPGSAYFYVIGSPANPSMTVTEANPPTAATMVTTAANPPVIGGPSLNQFVLANYDPMTASAGGPTFQWYPGMLPGMTTNVPPLNYSAKIPVPALGTAKNYWVCLRRPANPFAPVSLANPMCVVDSMRVPYIEGTGSSSNITTVGGATVAYTYGTYNSVYSSQRLQPYRGGHAVAAPNIYTGALPLTTPQPPDPRYGYTEQLAVPQTNSTNYGVYFSTTAGDKYAATGAIYHTLGAPNDSAENWDYLVFNDRDFTSVAELTLVPGCPPGLFTKQFNEVAPSQINAANIFATVTPVVTPTFVSTGTDSATTPPAANLAVPFAPAVLPAVFATATAPYLSISQATPAPGSALPVSTGTTQPSTGTLTVPTFTSLSLIQPTTGITSPVQPHSFPYLVDKFFYSGASNFYYPPTQIATDPSVANNFVVGGPAGDGWFKMFEFLEVPSQMIGTIGPVALGTNFDWSRQDTKPGLMNINLIIDEEAFFSVFGQQDGTLNQTLLNSIELPLLTLDGSTLPYSLPLSTANGGNPPIPLNGPPVPLVVSAITNSGAPNYVYPMTNQFQQPEHGFLLGYEPIQTALNGVSGITPIPPSQGNRIKAAFAQFLWLRHGGSGYLFGYGTGGTGQNSSVATPVLSAYAGAIPSERYFHSLSYPDINYTIMRPAALPPSTVSAPAMVLDTASTFPPAVSNAQSLLYQPAAAPTSWYFVNGPPTPTNLPNYYAPYVTQNTIFTTAVAPVVYTGDPGVRNPWLSQGYSSSAGGSPYGVYPAQATNTVPVGVPLPVNVAFPSGTEGSPTMTSVAMPPAIPPRRMFQSVDGYGSGAIFQSVYTGMTTLPPSVSNATDSGDPWINNQVPNATTLSESPTGALYSLNNGFANLEWSGGTLYNPSTATPPVLVPQTPTGALPPVSTAYQPFGITTVPAGLTNLLLTSNSNTVPEAATKIYLGTGTGNTDDRQHPYWRSEQLQKAMNLTTTRTHQYAVWITVGFFQVKRQGDLGMFATNPQLAFDILGPEVGASNGKNTRFRSFYIIDRLQLTGYNPASSSNFRAAVLYSNRIQ